MRNKYEIKTRNDEILKSMHEHREDEHGDVTDFDPALDYIEILGVSSAADATEIKRRYEPRPIIFSSSSVRYRIHVIVTCDE